MSVSLLSKFRGSIIGGLLGDCLGAPFEDDNRVTKGVLDNFFTTLLSGKSKQIFSYTDDTAMTISVASSLAELGKVDTKDLANRFTDGYFKQPRRGYGLHVTTVFEALARNGEDVFSPAKLQFNGAGSYGNGAAMRVSPIALFGYQKAEGFLRASARACSLITHAHKEGYNGAILQCLAVHAALHADSKKDLDPVEFISYLETQMEDIESKGYTKPYCTSLKTMKEIYLQQREDISPTEIAEYLGNGIAALESVPTAIYSFLRGMKPLKEYECSNPFVRTLYFSIAVGGDTDTIATMAGSIAGAYYGIEMIPIELQERCEFIDGMMKLADKLFDSFQSNSSSEN